MCTLLQAYDSIKFYKYKPSTEPDGHLEHRVDWVMAWNALTKMEATQGKKAEAKKDGPSVAFSPVSE